MLIVYFVFTVSQGDFFGSEICQGRCVPAGVHNLVLMHPRTLNPRLTSGAHPSRPYLFGIETSNSDALSTAYITRRAQCHLQMLKPHLAIGDFKKVIGIEPHNKTVKQQLEATQKLVRRIEFEKVGLPQGLVTAII